MVLKLLRVKKVLGQKFFERPAVRVAQDLLGKFLVRRWRGKNIVLMIAETEAYHGPYDRASHAARGLTPRNRPRRAGFELVLSLEERI